jgi:hypothetical protein
MVSGLPGAGRGQKEPIYRDVWGLVREFEMQSWLA